MDLPINHFKHAIAAGKKPVGAWLVSAAPSAAEALGYIGFDFLVVDMEHTPDASRQRREQTAADAAVQIHDVVVSGQPSRPRP